MRGHVFVTDAGYKHTLGIVRSLGRKALTVDIGSSSNNIQLSSLSKYCHKSFIYPDPKINPNGFIHFFSKIKKMADYEVVIPVGYNTTFLLSMKKESLERDIRIPIADFLAMKVAANKADSILLAEKTDIPVPKTMFIQRYSELDDLKNIRYPVVVKGVYEGGFVRYAYNRGDLERKFLEIYSLQGVSP